MCRFANLDHSPFYGTAQGDRHITENREKKIKNYEERFYLGMSGEEPLLFGPDEAIESADGTGPGIY